MPSCPLSRAKGFTLLEMSIVLAIIAVVMGSGLAIFSAALEKQQLQQTNAKLAAIQKALLTYRTANNRIPCPADITYPYASQYFGVEGENPGNCTTGATYNSSTGVRLSNNPAIPAATFYSTLQRAALGMVPTKTLELPDEYAIDGWGNRIIYVVNPSFTGTNAFTVTVPMTTASTFVYVEAATGGTIKTTMAAYVLMSTGPNGHGGWPRSFAGTTIARISSGSVNTDEQTNCHCTATAAAKGYSKIFIQHLPTLDPSNILDSFDDVVVYGTRYDLRSPIE